MDPFARGSDLHRERERESPRDGTAAAARPRAEGMVMVISGIHGGPGEYG